jgi:glycosyltransferase involved in cell wall biosynthesis
LVGAKGVADAVQAWSQSGGSLPLVFAGSGPERERLERQGFEVLGWVPHERLSSVYRRARALLVPSRWQEPFGIVGPEALRMGVPVVAWDSGGVRDWHPAAGASSNGSVAPADPGPAGALVPWGDVQGLARALADILRRQPAGSADLLPSQPARDALSESLLSFYRGGVVLLPRA